MERIRIGMPFLRNFRTKQQQPEEDASKLDPHDVDNSASDSDFTDSGASEPSCDPSDLPLLNNVEPDPMREIRDIVMVNWLHEKQEERLWTAGAPGEGVMLKVTKGQYVCCPANLRNDSTSLFEVVSQLNVRVRSPCKRRKDASC
jgi:hypothetical protein